MTFYVLRDGPMAPYVLAEQEQDGSLTVMPLKTLDELIEFMQTYPHHTYQTRAYMTFPPSFEAPPKLEPHENFLQPGQGDPRPYRRLDPPPLPLMPAELLRKYRPLGGDDVFAILRRVPNYQEAELSIPHKGKIAA
jgi:hypothetical protein